MEAKRFLLSSFSLHFFASPFSFPLSAFFCMPLRIAIVVQGRFHAFDLARGLMAQGAQVTLLTNYPKTVAEKFGIPRQHVRTCLSHGVAARLVHRGLGAARSNLLEPVLHRWF